MFILFLIALLTIISIGLLINETYIVKLNDFKKSRMRSIISMTIVLLLTIYIGFDDSLHTIYYYYDELIIKNNSNFVNKRIPLEKNMCHVFENKLKLQKGVASQYGQDVVLYQIFKDYKNGVFVDLAAAFPKRLSNTFWLETCNDWTGFCIEADSRKIVDLVKNRTCQVIPECVMKTAQKVNFGDTKISGINAINEIEKIGSFELYCRPLNVLLSHYGSPLRIDYMSLDIEGSEAEALNSIGHYIVDTMTIELAHLRKNRKKSDEIKKVS